MTIVERSIVTSTLRQLLIYLNQPANRACGNLYFLGAQHISGRRKKIIKLGPGSRPFIFSKLTNAQFAFIKYKIIDSISRGVIFASYSPGGSL